jgi:hypothetical protein
MWRIIKFGQHSDENKVLAHRFNIKPANKKDRFEWDLQNYFGIALEILNPN